MGTLLSALVISLVLRAAVKMNLTFGFNPTFPELLTFGSWISATDPVSTLTVFQAKRVNPQLFILLFGESILNDAVSIVLFNSLSKFIGKKLVLILC